MNIRPQASDDGSAILLDLTVQDSKIQVLLSRLSTFQGRARQQLNDIGFLDSDECRPNTTDWQKVLVPTQIARRLVLDTNQHQDINQLKSLLKIYAAEQRCLQALQGHTLLTSFRSKDFGDGAFSLEDQVMQFQGIYGKIRNDVDAGTTALGLTQGLSSDISIALPDYFPQEHEIFLEDLFRICQLPNEGEICMLQRALRIPEQDLRDWFQSKRDQQARYFTARAATKNKAAAILQERKILTTKRPDSEGQS